MVLVGVSTVSDHFFCLDGRAPDTVVARERITRPAFRIVYTCTLLSTGPELRPRAGGARLQCADAFQPPHAHDPRGSDSRMLHAASRHYRRHGCFRCLSVRRPVRRIGG